MNPVDLTAVPLAYVMAAVGVIGALLITLLVLAVIFTRARTRAENALQASRELERLAADRATVAESRLQAQEERLQELRAQQDALGQLQGQHAQLQERYAQEQQRLREQQALLDDAKAKLAEAFKSLSADALRANNQSFLELARENLQRFQQGAQEDLAARHKSIEQLTQPIREKLEKFEGHLGEMEKARIGAYEALNTQVHELVATHLPRLHAETANLVKALRQPSARGRWGEVQLRRVVEMAGMLEHCDFDEQASRSTEEGRLRPDLIVRLPGGRQIVVDAKAPVDAYLTAVEARDDLARDAALVLHAQQVRAHVTQLGKKSYFEQFSPAPEFVVLFVPGEAFFSAALAQDPHLIEYGAEVRVIPASPTTLIALLKAVAYGWRQEALARNAQQVAALGKELYERLCTMGDHWARVGAQLDKAVESYNKASASLDTRVMSSARKFVELRAAAADELPAVTLIDRGTRPPRAGELAALLEPDNQPK
jgi:DNA recombination protein RmuC